MILLLIFLIVQCAITLQRAHTDYTCSSFAILKNKFINNKPQNLEYRTLDKSNVNEKLVYTLETKHDQLKVESLIYKNKKYLFALSKFIDYKINLSKIKYRAKENIVLIDEISKILAYELIKSNNCKIFEHYKYYVKVFKIKQKENKIFKLLLSQKLFLLLTNIESELIEISKTIKTAKTSDKIVKFNKKLLFNAQIYSIVNFNPNATKLLHEIDIDHDSLINQLFLELLESESKIKIIINYLIAMYG